MTLIRQLLLLVTTCATLLNAAPPTTPARNSSVLAPEQSQYPENIALLHVTPEGKESLRTPIARYRHADGRTVDLVGAIHLADARYYHVLNRTFARYDRVLYEMVDGEDLPEIIRISRKIEAGIATDAETERYRQYQASKEISWSGKLLNTYYIYMADLMKLSLQTNAIDYGRTNWVYADMSSAEFAAAMAERGETWLTLVLDSLQESSGYNSTGSLFSTPNATELRRMVCRQLAATAKGSRAEKRAIITARNERCFEVLDHILAEEPAARHLAIFYGAMHLRDMHHRLLQRGFSLQGVQWITAIRVD